MSGWHVWRTRGWYAGGAFDETDAAHPAPLPTSFSVLGDELTARSLTLGKYLRESTTLELSLQSATTTLTSELLQPCTAFLCAIVPPTRITTVIDNEVENASIAATHVGRLGRFPYVLAGGVTRSEIDARIETTRTPVAVQPLSPPVFIPSYFRRGQLIGRL